MVKKRFISILSLLLAAVILISAGCGGRENITEDDYPPKIYKNEKDNIWIGDTDISEYTICYSGRGAEDTAYLLQDYIKRTCDSELGIASKVGERTNIISLVVDSKIAEPGFKIADGDITIEAPTQTGLLNQVFVFLNTYLGWMYAGNENETISDTKTVLHIPENVNTESEEPWIEKREAIVTLWKTNFVRNNYYNENTSTKTDVLSYSDEQLYEYVKMLKWCGYTGVQVTDICSSWVGFSGYEYVHDRLRFMANAAHSMDMDFTLWVWAANFDGFGWVDEDVTYDKGTYEFQYQNPDVVACFDKYYDIYTELADVSDRVICHFYDPGNLDRSEDVAFFSKMLMDKMKAVNPDIDFGVSCWIDVFDVGTMLATLGTDVTLYEGNFQADGGETGSFRNRVNMFACRLGTWSWDTCGMEIDQLASMQYNAELLKNTYNRLGEFDDIMKPGYWSEMDSYHILNAFSLYAGGHLLIDKSIDTDRLTYQVAEEAVGPEYAQTMADVLRLLEKARTGNDWDTYWWESEDYILRNAAYPTEEILQECNRLIPLLEKMAESGVEGYYMPTPVPMKDIIKLIIPHLQQIKEYAQFRYSFDELRNNSTDYKTDELSAKLYDISEPVKEYNTIIGTWGQIEARQQRIMVLDFCDETGAEVPVYPYYDRMRKERMVRSLAMQQKGHKEPVSTWTFAANIAYYTEERRLTDELIAEGIFTADEGIWYHLTNWEDYIYDFNQ